jgi:hypothetical protein
MARVHKRTARGRRNTSPREAFCLACRVSENTNHRNVTFVRGPRLRTGRIGSAAVFRRHPACSRRDPGSRGHPSVSTRKCASIDRNRGIGERRAESGKNRTLGERCKLRAPKAAYNQEMATEKGCASGENRRFWNEA